MPRMTEIETAYYEPDGRLVEVYASRAPRREVQVIRKATARTGGRKTQTQARAGLGSWKGCK